MKLIITALVILYTTIIQGQIISNYSIDSGGDAINTGSLTMIYTIGEVNLQELNAGNIYISEGFINPSIFESLSTKSYLLSPIVIYPNPTSKFLNITTKDEISKIDIFDLNGRKMSVENPNKQIDVSYLSTGIYLVKIYSIKGQITKKIVVE